MTRLPSLVFFAALLALAGCSCNKGGDDMDVGPDAGDPDGRPGVDAPGVDAPGTPPPTAVLVIHALDVWGQPLPRDTSDLTLLHDSAEVETSGWPDVVIPLSDPITYQLNLAAFAHHAEDFTVTYSGGIEDEGLSVQGNDPVTYGLLVAHGDEMHDAWDEPIPTHHVLLGLRHQFFSAQGPAPRRGNDIELYTSGETAWAAVDAEMRLAERTVEWASWWWESDFELVRPEASHATLSTEERRANTAIAALDSTTAEKRILIGQFVDQDGILSSVNNDPPLRDRGATADDGFQFMGQANETAGVFELTPDSASFADHVAAQFTDNGIDLSELRRDPDSLIESVIPIREVDLTDWPLGVRLEIRSASWHQKFGVIDGEVAFVGGMNCKGVDWDTDEHLVYEPRRMPFDASTSQRLDVRPNEELPEFGPRKDFMVRIDGPIVSDVQEVFRERWDFLIDMGVNYSENASPYPAITSPAPVSGGVQAQVTTTAPDPFWQHSIAESWLNAVAVAEDYIFIEDQYFRIPMLVDAIIARMTEVPDLQLIVVTKPINEFVDPGCEWTYRTHEQLIAAVPERYTLLKLRAFDIDRTTFGFDETNSRFLDMDIHSKMLIVDDVFLSIGSANKNNRGIVYEGEINIAVHDAAWTRTERRRIIQQYLPEGVMVADEVNGEGGWLEQLRAAASWNDFVWQNWVDERQDLDLDGDPLPDEYQPLGFVYSLRFRDHDECLIEGVGPDLM